MRPLNCPSCGAPLEVEEGQTFFACAFCGATVAPTQQVPKVRPAAGGAIDVVRISGPRLSPSIARGCTAAVLLLVLGIGAFVVLRARAIERSVRQSISTVTQAFPPTLPTSFERKETPLPLARLAEPGFTGEHLLEAAPPPVPFGAFEPIAALPWALTIAQLWSRDVKLERIDVDRVRPEGTVNLQDDPEAEVLYRFVSPSRFEALRERMNLEKYPRGDQEFWVRVQSGKVFGYELSTLSQMIRDDDADELARLTWPKSLPLTEILPALGKRKNFPKVPFYEGYLIRLEDEGWCWYLSTLSGSPSIPRVRARDARVWPY